MLIYKQSKSYTKTNCGRGVFQIHCLIQENGLFFCYEIRYFVIRKFQTVMKIQSINRTHLVLQPSTSRRAETVIIFKSERVVFWFFLHLMNIYEQIYKKTLIIKHFQSKIKILLKIYSIYKANRIQTLAISSKPNDSSLWKFMCLKILCFFMQTT